MPKLLSGNNALFRMKIWKVLKRISLFSAVLLCTCCEDKNPITDGTLAEVINAYRVEKGLPEIPVSPSLTTVAEAHVRDLSENHPNTANCNLHSWSDKGNWTACCYTDDHANAGCSWSKPRELTKYKGNGYEIAAWSSNGITASQALSMWKNSEGHHNVILNKGVWADAAWNAMGAAIYNGYAVVWFGQEYDNQ
jgi:hypothetical protein